MIIINYTGTANAISCYGYAFHGGRVHAHSPVDVSLTHTQLTGILIITQFSFKNDGVGSGICETMSESEL